MELDAVIRRQVEQFYRRVRADDQLGPLFSDHVDDWDHHIDRLCDFWSSILMSSGRYKGNPYAAHLAFAHRLTNGLFSRWLELWGETARQTCPPEIAALLEAKAGRIAQSLSAGLLFDTTSAKVATR